MNVNDCFQLGRIIKPHGLHGDVHVFLETDNPSYYSGIDMFLLKVGNDLVPYEIEFLNLKGDLTKGICKLEEIDSLEEAQELNGVEIYLPLQVLPKLDDDQYYYHEIEGYEIIDNNLGKLGFVESIYNMPTQDLIGMRYKDSEVLIPMVDDVLLKVNKKDNTLHVNLPEGLLDVYLE